MFLCVLFCLLLLLLRLAVYVCSCVFVCVLAVLVVCVAVAVCGCVCVCNSSDDDVSVGSVVRQQLRDSTKQLHDSSGIVKKKGPAYGRRARCVCVCM